ncbi:hypothetical protein NQZ68_026541 [Dissostichus eleginoides]|nr:hypothetical protein NQZ68_026541 [Dissostichus eleginoides]
MECSSVSAASDCIKQPSRTAKGLTRDAVISPLLLCAFSFTYGVIRGLVEPQPPLAAGHGLAGGHSRGPGRALDSQRAF